MKINHNHLRLAIDSPSVPRSAYELQPPTWPLPSDFPIVSNASGEVLCRYRDPVWDLSIWANKPTILDFLDSTTPYTKNIISPENGELLKQIAAWWLYGPQGERSAQTLRNRFYEIRSIFVLCSKHKIIASDINRFPRLIDELVNSASRRTFRTLITTLHVLYEQRELLGFMLLDPSAIIKLNSNEFSSEIRQTPYIPPRIWNYQVTRLREFLDDFNSHKDQIKNCFNHLLVIYDKDFNSNETNPINNSTIELIKNDIAPNNSKPQKFDETFFWEIAQQHKIDKLLEKWLPIDKNVSHPKKQTSQRRFSAYFTMTGYVGIAYILNFSLMRISEAWSLKYDCLDIEQDQNFGSLYMLRGQTSKTINDDSALWPTSPSVSAALDAMRVVSELRMKCVKKCRHLKISSKDSINPYLILRSYEPWGSCGIKELHTPISVKHQPQTYLQVLDSFPKLFDANQLLITQQDLNIARLITPTLDNDKYSIGKIWPLAWHQLRRTGAVNMQASDLVSDPSIQYLLKHSRVASSLYYGQGYSARRLEQDAHKIYINTMYEIMGREITQLFTDRFISPHGQKRKEEILNFVSSKDLKVLSDLASKGRIAWRETLLGGCTNRSPCPYGGIENVAHCGGGIEGKHACPDVLYDSSNEKKLKKTN